MAYWCDDCELAEETDHCSRCGADLRPPERQAVPWRWRFFFVAAAVYLGYRTYQIVSWLSH